MKFARFVFCLSLALAVAIPVVAQEGYPLSRHLVWRLGNFCERPQSYDPGSVLGWQDRSGTRRSRPGFRQGQSRDAGQHEVGRPHGI